MIDTQECVVRLAGEGNGRPLFLVHGIGGTVHFFSPVARRLAPVRDVYGLQCHGVDPWNEPDRTIEAMAARYAQAMVDADPVGPYEVAGYSMGGLVACEISRWLRTRGRKVRLTGLIDTVPPGSFIHPVGCATALRLISRVVGLSPVFDADPTVPDEVQMEQFIDTAVARGALRPGFGVQHLRPMVNLYQVNGAAANAYRPTDVDGPVHFLVTEAGTARRNLDAWRDLAVDGFHPEFVDADHFALMHETHAAQVAAVLTRWIDRP